MWVSSDAKAGKDAGELAGLDRSTGVTATTDLDAILAAKPECVVYTAMADNRLVEALEDYRRILPRVSTWLPAPPCSSNSPPGAHCPTR